MKIDEILVDGDRVDVFINGILVQSKEEEEVQDINLSTELPYLSSLEYPDIFDNPVTGKNQSDKIYVNGVLVWKK